MHAIKGGWVGQTFALSKSNESGGRKCRIRRSKEERKGLVELFIKKYQSLNNGNFPSLNLTHKEVGGSFYTVREIVREIIQENRVLGSAKFLTEEQESNKWSEQYPLGTISTEPRSFSALTPNGTTVPSDQCPSSHEEFSFSSHGLAEIHDHNAETGQIINANFVVVGNAESDQQTVNEFQATEKEVAPIEDISVPADVSIDNNSVKTVLAEVQVGGSLGSQPSSNVVGDAIQDTLGLQVGGSHEQMKAGTEKGASEANTLVDSHGLEVEESDRVMPAEDQAMETEKSIEEVADAVLLSPSLEDEEFKEQVQPELQVTEPGKSAKEVVSSTAKVFEIEDVLEIFPLPTVSGIDGNANFVAINGSIRTSKEIDSEKVDLGPSKVCFGSPSKGSLDHFAAGDYENDNQNSSLLESKSIAVNEQASRSPVGGSVVVSDLNTVKGIIHDGQLGVEVKPNDQASRRLMNRGRNTAPGATSVSAGGTQGSVSGSKANAERSKSFQKRGDPALDRINMSWQRSPRIPSQAEANPLWVAFQAFVTAFIKFLSE